MDSETCGNFGERRGIFGRVPGRLSDTLVNSSCSTMRFDPTHDGDVWLPAGS